MAQIENIEEDCAEANVSMIFTVYCCCIMEGLGGRS